MPSRKQNVLALESREGTRASRRVEEGLWRSLSGGGGKPSCPSPSAGDLRELPGVPLRGEGSCGGGGAPRDSAGSGAHSDTTAKSLGAIVLWISWQPPFSKDNHHRTPQTSGEPTEGFPRNFQDHLHNSRAPHHNREEKR